MAFSVRLTGYARQTGETLFRAEPPWWLASAFRADTRWCTPTIEDGYVDYHADLSVAAARALHEQHRSRATQGVFADADWQAIIRPLLDDLDNVFGRRASEFSHFRITVFEWESGLSDVA